MWIVAVTAFMAVTLFFALLSVYRLWQGVTNTNIPNDYSTHEVDSLTCAETKMRQGVTHAAANHMYQFFYVVIALVFTGLMLVAVLVKPQFDHSNTLWLCFFVLWLVFWLSGWHVFGSSKKADSSALDKESVTQGVSPTESDT